MTPQQRLRNLCEWHETVCAITDAMIHEQHPEFSRGSLRSFAACWERSSFTGYMGIRGRADDRSQHSNSGRFTGAGPCGYPSYGGGFHLDLSYRDERAGKLGIADSWDRIKNQVRQFKEDDKT